MEKILTPDEFNKVVQELTEEQLAKVDGGREVGSAGTGNVSPTPIWYGR